MGASFHAAAITALHLQTLRIPALAVEAVDLLNYSSGLLREQTQIVFVSQSGNSGEVLPILAKLPASADLIGVTNQPSSPLAARAQVVLALHAGAETTVATKTYVNALAVLWLLARQWGQVWNGHEMEMLAATAEQCENILARPQTDQWLDLFRNAERLFFLGHGPHAITARHAAMMVSEWAKRPVYHASIGAFRHGLIESAQPGLGVVIFAPPGQTAASARALGQELERYGVQVLYVSNGRTLSAADPVPEAVVGDEFLSPILDVLPAQLFAEALARFLNVPPGFRYITKVVKAL